MSRMAEFDAEQTAEKFMPGQGSIALVRNLLVPLVVDAFLAQIKK